MLELPDPAACGIECELSSIAPKHRRATVEPRVRERTLRSYREVLDLYIRPDLGKRKLGPKHFAHYSHTAHEVEQIRTNNKTPIL